MAATYQRRLDVAEQQVGGERMIFDEAADRVHVLNGSAAFIWDCLKAPLTVPQVEERLRSEYEVTTGMDLSTTVTRTLTELQKKGLVEVHNQGAN
jgi:hypothetical protein